jgi:hypothetical protein
MWRLALGQYHRRDIFPRHTLWGMALQKFSQDFLDGRLHSYGDVLVVVPKSVSREALTLIDVVPTNPQRLVRPDRRASADFANQ